MKVAFVSRNWNFLADIYRHVGDRHEVRQVKAREEIPAAMEWADVAWFEWANEFAVDGSRCPAACKRIVRLHRYEAYNGSLLGAIDWSGVDDLIFVSKRIRDLAMERQPRIGAHTRVHVIPNGIDPARFPLKNGPLGKRACYLGDLAKQKGSQLLPHAVRSLELAGCRVTLCVRARADDLESAEYLDAMIRRFGLKADLVPPVDREKVPEFLAAHDMILNTSVVESQGVALGEAMMMGLRPLVHAWPGAEEHYRPEWIWSDGAELKALTNGHLDRAAYRAHALNRWDLTERLKEIDEVIDGP